MILFWIASALMAGGAVALMARSAAAAARADAGAESAAVGVYRRQLSEIEDLAERGLIAAEDARAVRGETGRRLLAAAREPAAADRPGRPGVLLTAIALPPLLAFVAYLIFGAPGLADAPFAKRVAEWRASDPHQLDPPRRLAVMSLIAAERPNDPQALKYLAIAHLAAGDAAGAAGVLRRALALTPDNAELWSGLGQAITLQNDGEVTAEAKTAFAKALALDPASAAARYFLARARIAGGDLAGGLADWKTLAASLPAGDERVASLNQEIAQVTEWGGLENPAATAAPQTPPGAPPGVGGEMAGAIEGMVAGLAARLEQNPNDPQGWVRLVRAYTVLGRTDKRDAALARARALFKDQPAVLTALDDALKGPTQ
ncbi:MAG: c-type cytochrome biogenesis protein CcmI [Caulobacteraceae bacterium]